MPVVTREIVLCKSELWLAAPAPPPARCPALRVAITRRATHGQITRPRHW